MRDDQFEWDDAKAAANITRHRVPFDAARDAFDDPFAIGWLDDRERYGETRCVTLGMAEGRLLSVVHTMRDTRIRIISARGANPRERRLYHEQGD
ncbi:MAG: BrnT family toxin [Reyranella sp.]|nr:BrnT family toxin [Reyranella sp.]